MIENLISQALIDFDISHEEFSKIIYEKNNYEQIIDNIRSVKSINDLNKDTNYIYKNELDKACFVHDAAYSDSKDLTKRTFADKILKNKAFNIA